MLLERFYPVMGGTELQAQRLAEEIARNGHEVFILTSKLKHLAGYEKTGGIEIYRTNAAGKGMISSINFLISSFLFLLKNRNKYDLIHVHLASSHAFAAIAAKMLLGKKIILKFGGARTTGDIGTSLSKPWGKVKLSIIKKYFDAFIVPGKEVSGEVVSAGFPQSKIFIIPNGVNTDMFSPLSMDNKVNLRKKLNLPSHGFLFAYTGRIEKGKGLEVVLPLWTDIQKNICLVIVGSGTLSADLENKYGGDNIIFAGYRKNLQEYLQAADAFIFPSFGEGLSNALLEAMSCGLPVIANNIPSNGELINSNKNGVLINVLDRQEMKALISDIVLNFGYYSKMGAEARRTVEQKYSMKFVGSKNINLYAALVGDTTVSSGFNYKISR